MSSFSYRLTLRSTVESISLFVCLIGLTYNVGSVRAQQVFQQPAAVVSSPQDTLDSMRRMVDLVQVGQQRDARGLSSPSAPALSSPVSMAVTSTKFTSSSSWVDNRGMWKLDFPSGQVCSVSKFGSDAPAEGCR